MRAYLLYLLLLCLGVPHEGSSYAAQKDLQMARHRLEHVKSRVNELERIRTDQRLRQQQLPRQMSGEHLSNMLRGGYGGGGEQGAVQRQGQQATMPSPSQMDYQPSS